MNISRTLYLSPKYNPQINIRGGHGGALPKDGRLLQSKPRLRGYEREYLSAMGVQLFAAIIFPPDDWTVRRMGTVIPLFPETLLTWTGWN